MLADAANGSTHIFGVRRLPASASPSVWPRSGVASTSIASHSGNCAFAVSIAVVWSIVSARATAPEPSDASKYVSTAVLEVSTPDSSDSTSSRMTFAFSQFAGPVRWSSR